MVKMSLLTPIIYGRLILLLLPSCTRINLITIFSLLLLILITWPICGLILVVVFIFRAFILLRVLGSFFVILVHDGVDLCLILIIQVLLQLRAIEVVLNK